MLTITSERQVRVIYEVSFYDLDGELLGSRFFRTKRRSERIMNVWKKHGYDVSMRKCNRSEWLWINPNDIESEVN